MSNLATRHPAEIVEISPEALEVANCYLQKQNSAEVADELGISLQTVQGILGRREVKAYIDQVFFDTGFNNRFRLRQLMDTIIQKKLEEMDDAGMSSNKDILEILTLSHKMTMETLQKEIELRKLEMGTSPKSQTNIQINENSGGSKYGNLIDRIIKGSNVV